VSRLSGMRERARTVVALLPRSRVKNRLLTALGWQVHPTARVGICLIQRVDRLVVGERCVVGHANVLRDLHHVTFGPGARMGRWNWVSGARMLKEDPSRHHLELGRESALMSRNYVDASGGVRIGEFTTVAGVRSTFITHGIDLHDSEQRTAPIEVGAFSIVSSNVRLVPGAVVPDHSLVAMGAVVTPGLVEPYRLYAGAPATARRPLDPESGYFTRTIGPVSLDLG
jgi:acetyltransferase-like isoleucine patch superfamily enzyme